MKTFLLSVFCGVVSISLAKVSPPKVEMYSQLPAHLDGNHLVCYVSQFQPPDITIELLENGMKMPGGVQSDLLFESEWHYHMTMAAPFTPNENSKYTCKVTHDGTTNEHRWGASD